MVKHLKVLVLLLLCVSFLNAYEEIYDDDDDIDERTRFMFDGIPYVHFMNYTNIMHEFKKFVIYAFKDDCINNSECSYINYSRVAHELNNTVIFTKMNATESSSYIEEYTSKKPTILLIINRLCFEYNGTFTYEDIYSFITSFFTPEVTLPPSPLITVDKDNFTTTIKNISLGLLYVYEYEERGGFHDHFRGLLHTVAHKLSDEKFPVVVLNNTKYPEILNSVTSIYVGILYCVRYGKFYPIENKNSKSINLIIKEVKFLKKFGSTIVTDYKVGKYYMNRASQDSSAIFLAVLASNTSEWFKTFEELTNKLRGVYIFYHTFNPQIGEKFGCNQSECFIAIYNDKLTSPYDAERLQKLNLTPEELKHIEKVENYIKKSEIPLLGFLNAFEHIQKIYADISPKAILYANIVKKGFEYKETLYYQKKLWEIAKDYQGQITFVMGQREDFATLLSERHLYENERDVDFVIEVSREHFYIMKEKFNETNARNFIDNFLKKKIRTDLIGEEIPKESYDKYGIRILVSENFYDLVFDTKEDMVILLYANWCEQCKKFIPIFKETAKKYSYNKNLVFAKLNSDRNAVPPEYLSAEGYPAMYFASSGSKNKPILYQIKIENSIQDLSDFIEEHLTIAEEDSLFQKNEL